MGQGRGLPIAGKLALWIALSASCTVAGIALFDVGRGAGEAAVFFAPVFMGVALGLLLRTEAGGARLLWACIAAVLASAYAVAHHEVFSRLPGTLNNWSVNHFMHLQPAFWALAIPLASVGAFLATLSARKRAE